MPPPWPCCSARTLAGQAQAGSSVSWRLELFMVGWMTFLESNSSENVGIAHILKNCAGCGYLRYFAVTSTPGLESARLVPSRTGGSIALRFSVSLLRVACQVAALSPTPPLPSAPGNFGAFAGLPWSHRGAYPVAPSNSSFCSIVSRLPGLPLPGPCPSQPRRPP